MAGTEENSVAPSATTGKRYRCEDWLQTQNELFPKKSLQNQNDIQFIIECNAQRKNFFLSATTDDNTVPAGVDEPPVEPLKVSIRKLRVDNLRMLCEWQDCQCYYSEYDLFQRHVASHTPVDVDTPEVTGTYICMWDICGYKTNDYDEIERHVNYHAYHAKLLAIGFNGRVTLNLERCKKDSSKRNKIPALKNEHACLWTGCDVAYNSIQALFDHVKRHIYHTEDYLCSWAGCGTQFHRRVLLTMHVRRHTAERLIACYHCGRHFSCNRKLSDHLARQNVNPDLGYACELCGQHKATAHLLREHTRQHVSAYACVLCDMTAPTPAALAHHLRYRHVGVKSHACPECTYKAVTNWDLKKHMTTHNKKAKLDDDSDIGPSDEEHSDGELKRKKKIPRKYACHLCTGKQMKVFTRGNRLTTHLVKVHGAQWPYGYSRFRYQMCDDGIYRLTTTRYEYEDISRMIVDGYCGPEDLLSNSKLKFDVKQVAAPTDDTPRRFEVVLKNENEITNELNNGLKTKADKDNGVEITMCDVDEHGNIISSQIINSGVVFS